MEWKLPISKKMAEEALKKVEEQLNCSICLDTYTDPKLLQCFHTYCQKCLTPLVDRDKQIITSQCPIHEKELELYCDTCGELICWKCALKGGKHHDHDYEELNLAFKKYKEEITPYLEPLEKQVTTMEVALAQLNSRCEEISDQQSATEESINVTFAQLQDVLNARKARLIRQLQKITQGKLKGLAAQRDQIETSLAQLNSCLHFTRESLRKGKEGDVLSMKSKTLKKVKALATPVQPDTLEPNTGADIIFKGSVDVTALCRNYGQVYSPGLPDPSQCRAIGKGTQVAVVGEKSTAILQAINSEGTQCSEPIATWECELVSQITGTRVKCYVEKRQGRHEISYQPTIKGRHQLHIMVDGENIRGSPFSVSVTSLVEKLGPPIRTIEVGGPWGVAINQRGELAVTEKDRYCVSVFSPSGEKLRTFGTRGPSWGQFGRPRGIAVDVEGNILVADSQNNCIQKFTADGQFLRAVGTGGSGMLPTSSPTSIAISASKKLVYVTDWTNHRVQVLNSDLTFFSIFGKHGSGKGQFNEPWGIACNSTGEVYVVDTYNHRVQVFTAEGRFLRMFGRHGQGKGELDGPNHIALDSNGMAYVSEGENHRISVFTSEGQFVTSFGKKGDSFRFPVGLAVDSCGVVYVCSWGNHKLQLF